MAQEQNGWQLRLYPGPRQAKRLGMTSEGCYLFSRPDNCTRAEADLWALREQQRWGMRGDYELRPN